MKLILIKPNIGRLEHSLFVDEARMEPLQIGVLAALTPPHVEVAFYDDRIEDIPYDAKTDLVAITVETFTARRAYEISSEFRQRGVKVILGGMHVTLLPDEAACHADSVFIGDAELLWKDVIMDAVKGRIKPVYYSKASMPQPDILPRRDIFEGKGYLPITLLQFGRGCRYRCEFCAVSSYFNHHHFCRRIEEVIKEIENQKRRQLFFVDDNILANHAAAKNLFKALIPLGVEWVSQASLDMTSDVELMELMVQSGCLGNVIGFESITYASLVEMNKTPNFSLGFEQYESQVNLLRKMGLQTWAAFTLGHDHDTPDSIKQTLDFALENKFAFAAFNILMPYPKTKLYERLKHDDRLLYEGCWWLNPDYRFNYAAFNPQNMSAEELTDLGNFCRKKFNSIPSILYRALDAQTNMRTFYRLITFLIYSRLFRQETFKKHGMRFGLKP